MLKKGQPAPFDGKLYNARAVANITASYEADISKLESEVASLKKQVTLISDAEKSVCEATVSMYKHQVSVCEASVASQKSIYEGAINRVVKSTSPRWYENPYFNYAMGIASCAAIVGSIKIGSE